MAYSYFIETRGYKQMTIIYSKALYLGNIGNEDYGFTVGKEYKIYDFEDGYILTRDNNGAYCYINNGKFHKFDIREKVEGFVTENECAAKATDNN